MATAGKIKVTPEQLQSISGQLNRGALNIEHQAGRRQKLQPLTTR
jgi:hypothetical protein